MWDLPERNEWLEPDGSVYDAYEEDFEETWQETLPIPEEVQRGIWDRKIIEIEDHIRRLEEDLKLKKMQRRYYKDERLKLDAHKKSLRLV